MRAILTVLAICLVLLSAAPRRGTPIKANPTILVPNATICIAGEKPSRNGCFCCGELSKSGGCEISLNVACSESDAELRRNVTLIADSTDLDDLMRDGKQ